MKPTLVDVPYSRVFQHPIGPAYEWLTDYRDDDPTLTDRVVEKRRVIQRTKDLVVMEGEIDVLGTRMQGRVDVHLFPAEHRYEARIVEGRGKGAVFQYQLTPLGPDKCRIDIHYRVLVRRWRGRLRVLFGRPLIRRELDRMWDGFAKAMAQDMTLTA